MGKSGPRTRVGPRGCGSGVVCGAESGGARGDTSQQNQLGQYPGGEETWFCLGCVSRCLCLKLLSGALRPVHFGEILEMTRTAGRTLRWLEWNPGGPPRRPYSRH